MVFFLPYQVRQTNSENFWIFITSIMYLLLRFPKKSVFQVLHYTDGFVPLNTKPQNFQLL